MLVFIEKFWEFFKNIINVAGPVIIIIFVLALLAGLIKWSYRTKEWLGLVSSNPILLVVWILLSFVGIYFFYKYAIPLFK